MAKIRTRGKEIRRFILEQVEKHPRAIGKIAATHFSITRQAINKHLQKLVSEHALTENGNTRNRFYRLTTELVWQKKYPLVKGLAEDIVWGQDIKPILGEMLKNVEGIWHYGFTEMFNNAMDHSEGSEITVRIKKTAISTEILIEDNGIGIFKKIQTALNLLDERHAVFELSKGKLTTDPKRHSGEGIFFSSRMFDSYNIMAGDAHFSHNFVEPEDWVIEKNSPFQGTRVFMELYNHTSRTTKKIFDQYISIDYGFNKTVVPVRLAQYDSNELISRSQAKRLLARIELFKLVLFDFENIESIGQAFADEIFRVFANEHPNIELFVINANTEVQNMINRAKVNNVE